MEVHHLMQMNTVDMDEEYSLVVVNPSVQMKLRVVNRHPHMEVNTDPRMETNTMDMVVNPEVKMNLWVVNMPPHRAEMSPVDPDVVEPFMVVHQWVIVDSVVMEVHQWRQMNAMEMDEGYFPVVVNPSVK